MFSSYVKKICCIFASCTNSRNFVTVSKNNELVQEQIVPKDELNYNI